jgi:hypothetical protein
MLTYFLKNVKYLRNNACQLFHSDIYNLKQYRFHSSLTNFKVLNLIYIIDCFKNDFSNINNLPVTY